MKLLSLVLMLCAAPMFAAEPTTNASGALNALGLDLLRQSSEPEENLLLSPYSIQCALAMAYAGAAGETRTEMAKALHYPESDEKLHGSFLALRNELDDLVRNSSREAEQMKKWGKAPDPITLTAANRLFGQAGYDFREQFLALVRSNYDAPLEQLDFASDPAGATRHINLWVEDQTRKRIRNIIPRGALDELTRLVLVNAIYLKAPWTVAFEESSTKSLPFHVAGGSPVDVPTMNGQRRVGYEERDGYAVVAIPYRGDELQFLVLLPAGKNGLPELEKKMTADLLAECANVPPREVILHLPKLKLEPPVMALTERLQSLGMKTAFDNPAGSANFDRMAPRRATEYLSISEVFHKTFLNLDEQGTEAAAATAVAMVGRSAVVKPVEPIEVRVDHPFFFAIQDRRSGACLFLGRVNDPR